MGRSFSIKPLHSLVATNSADRVRARLRHHPRAPYEPTSTGNLPIHCAAAASNAEIVGILLEAAPDTTGARNDMGDTPLHCAAYHANDAAVAALVRHDQEPLVATNRAGDTPLMAATRACHASTVRRLLDAAPCSVLLANAKGDTPLYTATATYLRLHTRAAANVVLALLERQHADPDDAQLKALLCKLLATAAVAGHAPLVRRVLALDASLADAPPAHPAAMHPVKVAAQWGHADVLEALLAAAPHLATLEDACGMPPMQHAILGTHHAAVAVLLRRAPHTATHVPTSGVAPLVVAVQRGEPGLPIVRALLQAAPGAAEAAGPPGYLPVHYAVAVGNCEAARAILAAAPHTAGALDHRGNNALHYAIKFACPRSAEAVLERAPALAADDRCMAAAMALQTDPAALLRPLLAAAPSMATTAWLQRVVERDRADSVAVMLAAAPHLVQQVDARGCTPVEAALHAGATAAALVLVSARHPDPVALFVQLATFGAAPAVWVRAIETHVPLPPECWAVVPTPLPGLLAALPGVLQRGLEGDVGQAVAHMAADEQLFLRSSIQGLHRLPTDLARQILCMAI